MTSAPATAKRQASQAFLILRRIIRLSHPSPLILHRISDVICDFRRKLPHKEPNHNNWCHKSQLGDNALPFQKATEPQRLQLSVVALLPLSLLHETTSLHPSFRHSSGSRMKLFPSNPGQDARPSESLLVDSLDW